MFIVLVRANHLRIIINALSKFLDQTTAFCCYCYDWDKAFIFNIYLASSKHHWNAEVFVSLRTIFFIYSIYFHVEYVAIQNPCPSIESMMKLLFYSHIMYANQLSCYYYLLHIPNCFLSFPGVKRTQIMAIRRK